MNFIKLETQKLDIGAINDLVAHETCGAISMFVGTTRDNFDQKKVLSLEYEAFEPMAIKTMTTICDELRTNWPDIKNIAIYHRLGNVPVKEASVVIAISSPHRETSLLGVQYAINTLKKMVPIWKKEKYEGEESAWKENKESECGQSSSRKERFKLNFDSCTVEPVLVPKSLVQITADDHEVTRRINCFVEKKREEIDSQNISCFVEKSPGEPGNQTDEMACARVRSTVFKQKDSNGHLRVRRVKNEVGPQIKPDYASTLSKLMENAIATTKIKIKEEPLQQEHHALPQGLEERLENIERFLGDNQKPAPRNLYERVKVLEDRLLYLESISPEYYHFLGDKPAPDVIKRKKRPTYTIEELDKYIEDVKTSML